MPESSWPSPTHNSGSVTDDEYERLVSPGHASGWVGTATDTYPAFADGTGRQVKIRSGSYGWVRGRMWSSGAGIIKDVAANSSGSPRKDLLVLRLDRSTWNVTAEVITGTPASTPVAPTPTQNAGTTGVWEFPVATIDVAAGATALTASNLKFVGWFLASDGSITCTSTSRPPYELGVRFTEADTGRAYLGISGGYRLTYIDTGVNPVDASSGWSVGTSYRRFNDVVFVWGSFSRTASTTLSPGTNSHLGNIPAGSHPTSTHYWVGWIQGTNLCRGFINTSGEIWLAERTVSIATGDDVMLQMAAYPIPFA